MGSIAPVRLEQGNTSTNENQFPGVPPCRLPDNRAANADMEQGVKGTVGGGSLAALGLYANTPPLTALGLLIAFYSVVNFGRGYTERKPNSCQGFMPRK